jgi:hypothetical protein
MPNSEYQLYISAHKLDLCEYGVTVSTRKQKVIAFCNREPKKKHLQTIKLHKSVFNYLGCSLKWGGGGGGGGGGEEVAVRNI